MPAMTKEQLLNPRRKVHPLPLQEYDSPVLLGSPSGLLSIDLRSLAMRGESLGSQQALVMMAADMVVDERGAQMLSAEDAPRFLRGLSAESLTAFLMKCTELVTGPKKDEGGSGNSQPSTSAS